MSNPLFDMMQNGLAGSIMQMLPGMKQNPLSALQSAGFNVPNGLNDPKQILQHLVQSGQINQGQLDYAQQMARMLGLKI